MTFYPTGELRLEPRGVSAVRVKQEGHTSHKPKCTFNRSQYFGYYITFDLSRKFP